jgi:hypothetical protein
MDSVMDNNDIKSALRGQGNATSETQKIQASEESK